MGLIPFVPLLPGAHLPTIASNFWPRHLDTRRFPVVRKLYRTGERVQVVVYEQRPAGPPRGELILLHGLEGSSEAGYMLSMAQAALEAGFAVHRFNLRSCGGTESLCDTMYHAGLTCDVRTVAGELRRRGCGPVFLTGFSLGGNVALKLAGELGRESSGLLDGVCGVSVPIELGACVRRLGEPENRIYEWRFVRAMKRRLREKQRLSPGFFPLDGMRRWKTVYDIDDRFTAPSFGFRDAGHYYGTQSSSLFLDSIRIPALVVQAKNDPFIPFELFSHPAFRTNPQLRLLAVEKGGHLGFFARARPRIWIDGVVVDWVKSLAEVEQISRPASAI